MTISNILCQGVDNLFECPLHYRICTFVFIPIAIILQICGIGTENWIKTDDQSRLGLWKYCYDLDKYSCCQDVTERLDGVPAWLNATRAFQIMAFLTALATMVLLVLSTCVTKTLKNTKLQLVALVCCSTTVLFLVISVGIYGDKYRNSKDLRNYFVAGTFVIVICALIIYAVTIPLLIWIYKDHSRVTPITINQSGQVRTPAQDGQARHFREVSVSVIPSAPIPTQRTQGDENEQNECEICNDEQKEWLFRPCGHFRFCTRCADRIMRSDSPICPICRKAIREKVRVYA